MAYKYPYGNTEQMNLDWFLNQWEKFKADWAEAEAGIDGSLDAEIAKVEAAMSELYAARDAAAASATAARKSSLDAAAAQVAAGNSKTAAQAAETSARGSQQAAEQSAQEAQASAQGAENSALTASQAANTATQQAAGADAAKGAAEAAQQAAEDAQAAAAQSAGQAGQAATAAADHADNAADSATLARQAAQDMSDSVAQITTNKNDISDLKESIIYATGNEAIVISAKDKYLKISNNVIDINNPQTSSSGYGYVIVPCSEGDVFIVSGVSAKNEPMAWAFTDSTYTIITKASTNITVTDEKIVAPANAAYLVIHDKSPYRMSYKGVALKDIVKSAEQSATIISDAIELVSLNLFNPDMSDVINGGYYNQYGVWQNYPGQYCLFIKVKANDKVYRKYPSGYSAFNQVEVAFFNSNKVYVTGFKSDDSEFVTVPSNPTIEYITIPVSNTFFTPSGTYEYGVVSYSPITEFHPYGDGAYSRRIANLENSLEEATHWSGKTWFAYGTSITSTSLGKYAQYVAQFSGLNLNNKGITGGALVANRNIYNALNDLTDGKINADLITIEVGANDWTSPLGDVTTMDIDTFCGALNHSIQTILMNCPKAQVVLMCSTCSRKNDAQTENMDLDSANTYGVTAEERNEAIRKVAVANGIYFIPLGCGLGLGLFRMQSSDLYNIDQIHHTELGGYNLAKGMWSYLKNIPLWYNAIPS